MGKAKGASRGRIPESEESFANKAGQKRRAALHRGELGEAAFLHKAMSLGFMVAKPWGNICRYDFIVESGQKLWRVIEWRGDLKW